LLRNAVERGAEDLGLDQINFVKEALKWQYNWIGLGGAALFALVSGTGMPLVLAAGLELIYLSLVPQSSAFRRLVRSWKYAEDKRRREAVDVKNHGESLVHDAEKALKEYGDKVGAADRSAVEAALASLKTALQGDDIEAIKARTNDLMQVQMKLGEAMYKAAQSAGPEAGAPGGGKKDDVIDAEFREVDDDKKKSA